MLLRVISALMLMLFLAGCASTGKGTVDTAQIDPEPAVEADPIPSSTATIDEHLFVPDPTPVPAEAARAIGRSTVPSELGEELAVNPFLRCRQPTVVSAAQKRSPNAEPGASTLAVIRAWKDSF